jgi:predicted O-methyltransferase YrrM
VNGEPITNNQLFIIFTPLSETENMIAKPESANRLINMSEQISAWLRYSFNARHRRGHGVHSPFVFDFITSVLCDHNRYKAYGMAEEYRKSLKKNKTLIGVTGFGAGSRACLSQKRVVADIAKHASVNRKFGQLLFRLARHYKPDLIIELGTSLGISTHYLALGNPDARVTTIEAEPALSAIAIEGLKDHNITNVSLINDTFDHVLPSLLPQSSGRTLVFVDGNHSRSATLKYAGFFLSALTEGSLIVLDDINWSEGMRQAWKEIQTHEKNSLTIDLFSMGIVFIKHDFFMENYTIRF